MLYHNPMVMPHRATSTMSGSPNQHQEDDLKSTPDVVEDLANILKDNVRLSAMSSKTRSSVSRKSSRASPYRIPVRCTGNCEKQSCLECEHKHRRNPGRSDVQEDPYEVLQQLIKERNLVNEAVRRLNLSLESPAKPAKQFYESDEENSYVMKRHNVSHENSE